MKRTLFLSFVAVFLNASAAQGGWHFAWQQDAVTGDPTCSAATDPQPVYPGTGNTETSVSLGVEAKGLITIQSEPVSFDLDKIDAMGIAVDDHPLISRPRPSQDGRTLTFSEEDSVTLHRQFEESRVIKVRVVFAPAGRAASITFSLDNYCHTASQFKGCKGLLLNTEGWVGVYMTSVPEDPGWTRWVRGNTAYKGSGVRIMTVDPRKAAQRIDLRPGDVILGVDGADAAVSSFMRVLKGLDAGGSVSLDIARDQVLIKKTLVRPGSGRPK